MNVIPHYRPLVSIYLLENIIACPFLHLSCEKGFSKAI